MRSLFASLLLTLIAVPAFAGKAPAEPLLFKASYPGFTHPEWAISRQCEVFSDTVVKRVSLGGIVVETTREATVTGDLTAMVDAALNAPETTTVGPVDGPTLVYGATVFTQPKSTVLILNGEYGGSGDIVERDSAEARMLMRILDVLCQ